MKIKLKDGLDCLVVIFPQLDFKFVIDQLSGHCKVRKDRLVVNNMNVRCGG